MAENAIQQPVNTGASSGWDTTTYILLALALLALGGGAWIIYSEYAKNTMPAAPGNTSGTGGSTVPVQASAGNTGGGIVAAVKNVVNNVKQAVTGNTSTAANDVFPLHKGSKGPEVKKLQHYINTHSIANLVEDGIFGTKTETILKNLWQTSSVSKAEYDQMMRETDPNYSSGPLPQNANYGSTQSSDLA